MFFIIVICLVIKQSLAIEFAGGTGEPNNPYQIATAEQLQAIGDSTLEDKCFILVADIDLDPNLPGNEIVVDRSFISFFSGTLDGNGHSNIDLTDLKDHDYQVVIYKLRSFPPFVGYVGGPFWICIDKKTGEVLKVWGEM
jgi:hypothetical protein